MKTTTTINRTVELRKTNRYPVSAQVFFVWAQRNVPHQYGQGFTRDINPCGVYVVTETLPQVGTRVLLDIMLPKLAETGNGMHLTGDGVVLRVESRDADDPFSVHSGFAASVQFYPEKSEEDWKHFRPNLRTV